MLLHFLNEKISLPKLAQDGMIPDGAFMSTARQREGVLPEKAVLVIKHARAWELCRDFSMKIMSSKTFGIIELCQVVSSNYKFLAQSKEQQIVAMRKTVEDRWNVEYAIWQEAADKYLEVETIETELKLVCEAAKTGDFSSCSWVEEGGTDEGKQKLVKDYQNLFNNVAFMSRSAHAILAMFVDGAWGDPKAIEKVLPQLKAAEDNKHAIRDRLCIVAMTSLLCEKPRPDSFQKNLSMRVAWWKKLGYNMGSLPTFSKQLYDEALKEPGRPAAPTAAEAASKAAKSAPTASKAEAPAPSKFSGVRLAVKRLRDTDS